MLLESITVCGFETAEGKETLNFKTEARSEKKFINVNNDLFTRAFSVIFDSRYGSECDMHEIVNTTTKEKSKFVEIVLWQADQNQFSNYPWLKEKKLTLTRHLTQPKKILINGRSLDISKFHKDISRLGFNNNDGFCFHRLFDDEIQQLKAFTGSSLWSLVSFVKDCKELVQMIEKKHNVTKKKLMAAQVEQHLQDIDNILPSKLKLRNDTRMHFNLTKQLNTLMQIASKRKLVILKQQRNKLETELEKLTEEFDEKCFLLENNKHNTQMQIYSNKALADLTNIVDTSEMQLRFKLDAIRYDNANSWNLMDLPELVNQLNYLGRTAIENIESSDEQIKQILLHSRKIRQTEAELKAEELKLTLKQLAKTSFTSVANQVKMTMKITDEGIKEHSTRCISLSSSVNELIQRVKKTIDINLNEIVGKVNAYHEEAQEFRNQIENIHLASLKIYRKTLDAATELKTLAFIGNVNWKTVKMLQDIEAIANENRDIIKFYLGPVFNFLRPSFDIEMKIWCEISSIVNIILFGKGSEAREFNRLLNDANLGISYVLLGLDEYKPQTLGVIPEELADMLESADSIVNEQEKISHFIKLILRDIILVKNRKCDYKEILRSHKAIVYSRDGVLTDYMEFLKLNSVEPSMLERTKTSPVLNHQSIYKKIKQRITLMEQLSLTVDTRQTLEEALGECEKNLQNEKKPLASRIRSNSALQLLQQIQLSMGEKFSLQKVLQKEKLVNEAIKHVIEQMPLGIEEWNVALLKQSINQKRLEIIEENDTTEMMQQEINNSMMRLDDTVKMMKLHSQTISKIIADRNDPLKQMFINAENKEIAIMEHLENICKVKEEFEQCYEEKSTRNIQNVQMALEMKETRFKIYEKRSEKKIVVDDVIRKCREMIYRCNSDPETNFDQTTYDQNRRSSSEVIVNEIARCMKELEKFPKRRLSKDQYGHLMTSIKKCELYAQCDGDTLRMNEVLLRTYPFMNLMIVQKLKDAVANFTTSYRWCMSRYIDGATLFFYTQDEFNEINDDNFSWNSFDLMRLKAMDFVEKWKLGGKLTLTSQMLSTLKGLLLVIYIIHHVSIFKFVIIDEGIFEGMDEHLQKQIRQILEVAAVHIQVFMINKPQQTMIEPMDISE